MDVRTQIRRAARYFAQQEALVHGHRRLTFSEAWLRGVKLANALAECGLQPGDRIATLEKNSIEAADIILAAAIGNYTRVPLYARNRCEAHAHMIASTGSRLALVDEALASELAGLDAQAPTLERIIIRDHNYENWLATASDRDPDPVVAPEDYCVIRHTGGTTGKPKGVAYRHRSWMTISAAFLSIGPQVAPGDAILHVGPLSHASGFLFVPAWYCGARNVMMDGFDSASFLDTLEQERISHAFVAPTMLNAIVHHDGAYGRHFPNLKFLLSASAPISEPTLRKSCQIFGNHVLHSGYGQTEILPIASMGPNEWFGEFEGSAPIRAVGRPMSGADIEIRNEDGKVLGPNEPGEIVARFENGQMEEFWNDPEETARRMEDGWVKTGDVGMIDTNGFLYLLDRNNDMIVSGGFNIYPTEIENVIADHPGVLEVAVFGVPHEKWGETPLAMVRVKPGAQITETEIIDLVRQRLGSAKKPSKVVFTAEPLPLSNVGKVLRSKLREPYWAGQDRRISGA